MHSTIYKRFPTIDNIFNRKNMNHDNAGIGLGLIRSSQTALDIVSGLEYISIELHGKATTMKYTSKNIKY